MLNKSKLIDFLNSNQIEYATSGKNIGDALIGINCPYCRNDTGHHLGIFENGRYSCWKNSSHRGKVEYIFREITNLELGEIRDLIYEDTIIPEENLLDTIDTMLYNSNIKKEPKKLGGVDKLFFPKEFIPVANESIHTTIFLNYLVKRGFNYPYEVAKAFNLHCCSSHIDSPWANRLIFPFYEKDKLISWVGRDIADNPKLRYKNLSTEESVISPKFTLWRFPWVGFYRESRLYLVEGLFDAMKIHWYSEFKAGATSLLTTSITEEQAKLLEGVAPLYEEVVILLDSGAEAQAMKLYMQLSYLGNVKIQFLPEGIKDPGDLTQKEVQELVHKKL